MTQRVYQTCCAAILHCFTMVLCSGMCRGKEMETSFTFSKDVLQKMVFLGNASAVNGELQLTPSLHSSFTTKSTGRVLYREPVQMLDPSTNRIASFTTTFLFTISSTPGEGHSRPNFGDGMAFIIVPDLTEMGDSGKNLGIFNVSNNATAYHTVAIEFDTFLNPEIQDINSNHVGLDMANVESIVSKDAGNSSINFRDGTPVYAWIDFDGRKQKLEVRLSKESKMPDAPILSGTFNFSGVFEKFMYIGFTAASASNEIHIIHSWNFSSWCGSKTSHRNLAAIIAGMTIGILAAALICALIAKQAWKFKIYAFKRAKEGLESDMGFGPRKFSYKQLSIATKNFSEQEKVGHAGYGNVYRGVLVDSGSVVAIKCVSHDLVEVTPELLAEINTISCLRHRNLVQLQGWCKNHGELFLVYEFLPNGSLDKTLFNSKEVLPWSHRFTIVNGLAAALQYLHGESVIHRNVKASNVMLDNNFNARLGDFGISRFIEQFMNPGNTIVAGTFGYIAPEAVQTGRSTDKSDVFSFGAVTLEVVCGRQALNDALPDDEAVLVDWVWNLHREDKLMDAADPKLGSAYDVHEMETMLHVGLLCSSPEPSSRPTMQQVVKILAGEIPIPQLPGSKPSTAFTSDIPFKISIQDLLSESAVDISNSSEISNCSPVKRPLL